MTYTTFSNASTHRYFRLPVAVFAIAGNLFWVASANTQAQERQKSKKQQELERREQMRELTEDYVPSASRDGHHKTFQSKKRVRQVVPENKHVEKAKRKRHKKERKQDKPPYMDGENYSPEMPKNQRKQLNKHRKKFRRKDSPNELIGVDRK